MKKLLGILLLDIAVLLHSFGAPMSAEQLRSEFEAALNSKDTNRLASLYNWEGVSLETKSTQVKIISSLAGGKLSGSVKLLPLPADYQSLTDYDSNGFHYSPNTTIMGELSFDMVFERNGGSATSSPVIFYGKKGDCFCLPGYLKKRQTPSVTNGSGMDGTNTPASK